MAVSPSPRATVLDAPIARLPPRDDSRAHIPEHELPLVPDQSVRSCDNDAAPSAGSTGAWAHPTPAALPEEKFRQPQTAAEIARSGAAYFPIPASMCENGRAGIEPPRKTNHDPGRS